MEETASTLTVLFEDPFWVGIYERESDGRYQVCRSSLVLNRKAHKYTSICCKTGSGCVSAQRLNPQPRQQPALTLSGYNGTSTNNCSSGESAPKPNRR